MTMMAVITIIKLACTELEYRNYPANKDWCEKWLLSCYADQCDNRPRTKCIKDVEICIDQYPVKD